MANLHLQALHWTTNGELDPIDQLTVLNSLIPQCIATTQLELIRSVERLAVPVSEVTLQMSIS